VDEKRAGVVSTGPNADRAPNGQEHTVAAISHQPAVPATDVVPRPSRWPRRKLAAPATASSGTAAGLPAQAQVEPLSHAPSELKELRQFLNWRSERNDKGKLTKIPYQPNGAKAASTNGRFIKDASATWCSYEQAVAAYRRLDVAIRPLGKVFGVTNDRRGISQLVKRLKKLQPVCIAIDATGRLEKELAYALAAESLPVAVVNPRQVSNFAKSMGQRAKTDAIDAAVLAHFAEVMKPEVRPLPDAASRELTALVTRHRQLVEMMKAHI
jgi:hypothetical protein